MIYQILKTLKINDNTNRKKCEQTVSVRDRIINEEIESKTCSDTKGRTMMRERGIK